MALAAIVALVVMMLCLALVLDRLWLEGVSMELTTAAEAAALAGGRELAGDDLLREEVDQQARRDRIREKAAEIARQNLIAGEPLELSVSGDLNDVLLGRRVTDAETGLPSFEESSDDSTDTPNTVRVHAERSRGRWNPIALFVRGISSSPFGDAVEEAQATADNRLVGLRPYEAVNVPALPIAVLKHDPKNRRKDTWQDQIERRQGQDEFGYDPDTNRVTDKPDGIPEIVLQGMPLNGKPTQANVVVLDVDTGLQTSLLHDQIHDGWAAEDLARFDGELNFAGHAPVFRCGAALSMQTAQLFEAVVGQPKIVLLYSHHEPKGTDGLGTVKTVEPAAGRVMAVGVNPDGTAYLIFQPTVLTTRTAVLAHERPNQDEHRVLAPNNYVYKLQITH